MCLYPKLIQNKKYLSNKKNGGHIPPVFDHRVIYIPVGCTNCIECRKQKARQWQVRLLEDIKTNTNGKFITLTFSNKSIKHLTEECYKINEERIKKHYKGTGTNKKPQYLTGYTLDNEIATLAIRRFLERYRKQYKKSIRHWMVTELGHKGTENIHLHGIIWTDINLTTIEQIWNYGFIWKGYTKNYKIINYVNAQTVNYIIKYVNKIDLIHKEYKSKIFTSSGIGANYINTHNSKKNEFSWINETDESYKTSTGHKLSLPIYYRNKIYTDNQREELWIQKLNKKERWVCGEKIDVSNNYKEYYKILEYHRTRNKELGYGNNEHNWNRKKYENERRKLIQETRIKKQRHFVPPVPNK